MSNVADTFKEHSWVVKTAQTIDDYNIRRYEDWYRWNQDLRSMEAEAKKVSSIRKNIGWTNAGFMKRIASMPLNVFMMLRKLDPEMLANTKEGMKKFDRFLVAHPEFSVR